MSKRSDPTTTARSHGPNASTEPGSTPSLHPQASGTRPIDSSSSPSMSSAATEPSRRRTSSIPTGRTEIAVFKREIEIDVAVDGSSDGPAGPSGAMRYEIAHAPSRARFGRWDVLGRLAIGGMAEIFLAREVMAEKHTRTVVLKVVRPAFADEASFETMFVSEGRVATQLAHPHICHVYEFTKVGQRHVIAMEWVHGVTLLELVRRCKKRGIPLPPPIVVRIISDVAGALDYAHRLRDRDGRRLGVVHRDVSPQNIMISYDGLVKLLDFGVAKERNDGENTTSGTIKGKFSYMSPEQARGTALDGRTDLFSLGIVLYEALTARSLYRRQNQYDTLRAVIEEPPPSIRAHHPELPEVLDAIVRRALAKNPTDRYQTGAEMQEALEEWLVDNRTPILPSRTAKFLESVFAEEMARGPTLEPEAPVLVPEPDREPTSAVRTPRPEAPTSKRMPPWVQWAAVVGLLGLGTLFGLTYASTRSPVAPVTIIEAPGAAVAPAAPPASPAPSPGEAPDIVVPNAPRAEPPTHLEAADDRAPSAAVIDRREPARRAPVRPNRRRPSRPRAEETSGFASDPGF